MKRHAHLILAALAMLGLLSAESARSQSAENPMGVGLCGGAIVRRAPGPPPGAVGGVGPLNIAVSFDAVALGDQVQPFNIGSVNENLRMRINGGSEFNVKLTTGVSQSAADIVGDLYSNGTFLSQAYAEDHNGHVFVRSRTATFGSIEFIDAGSSAIYEIGLIPSQVYGPSMTAAQQALVLQAVAEWEARIKQVSSLPDPYSIGYAIHVFPSTAGYSAGGLAITFTGTSAMGVPQDAIVSINEPNSWFIDPTPANDDEFVGAGEYDYECVDPSCMGQYDMLTVLRHETGHAIGWNPDLFDPLLDYLPWSTLSVALTATQTFLTVVDASWFPPSGIVLVDYERIDYTGRTGNTLTGLSRGAGGTAPAPHGLGAEVINGNVFDPARLNIGVLEFGGHSDYAVHPNDLMNPGIALGQRESISHYPDLAKVARDQNYGVVMTFLDASNGGSENGTASFPWNTFAEAVYCPEGNVLVIPGNYLEPAPSVTVTVPCIYRAARGGGAVITSN